MSLRASWSCGLVVVSAAVVVGACADNQPPVLVGQQVTTDEDVPVEIRGLDGASDPDGDPLTVTGASAPDHLTQLLGDGTIRVTPKQDFHGALSVIYEVSDGTHTVTGHVTLTVRSVNDAPVAIGGTKDVHGPTVIGFNGLDADGDSLTYEIVAAPAHGTLTGSAPVLRYTPEAGFIGEDTITYRVLDGTVASEPAAIRLLVSPGSTPTALADVASGDEDHPLDLTLLASDPDNNPLTFTIVTPPRHGTLSGRAPNLLYTPEPNFAGNDSLVFFVSDGYQSSTAATISITVVPVNDAPIATPQAVAVTEDTGRSIALGGSDVDGDTLTFQVVAAPAHGTLSGSGATRTYMPALNYHGADSFTFVASDPVRSSAPATVTIDVASVEDPPVAVSLFQPLSEDTPAAVALRGSDGDGDAISFAIVTPPAHGTLSGTAPALTYSPAANFNGPDSFTYTTSDGDDTSAPATVSLQVAPVNDAPVAVDGAVTTAEDTPVAISLQASDVDGPFLSFAILSFPADGALTGTGANLTYTPVANASGTRTFTFRAFDGALTSTATVTIAITPVNDPPTTRDDFVVTEPGTPLTFSVTSNDFDVEGSPLVLDSVDAPAHGSVEIVGGQLVYTPDTDFTGTDVFAYTVVDALGAPSTGKAHVGVGTFPPGAPTETIVTVGGPVSTSFQRAPAISSNARYVAFTSALALVSGDTNAVDDIYLYDRGTRTVTRASVTTSGGQGNGPSLRPHLSADGRYVVFESTANNLVAGDTNGVSDVFRHDRVTGETVRVSVATGGGQGSGASLDAEISDDGTLVAFTSGAFELVANDANGASDIFVRDLTAGTTTRVSVSGTGGDADLGSTEPALSGDGRYVAFTSLATNLVAGDGNSVSDVFLHDRVAGTTTRISVSSTGGEADRRALGASLSRDGRFISFVSDATNLVSGASTGQVYVRDTQAQTTTRPVSSTFIVWARLSGDGRYLTVFTSAGVSIRDRFAAITVSPPGSFNWLWPMISGDGRYVAVLDANLGGNVTVTPNPL